MKHAKQLSLTFDDGIAALNEFKKLRVLGLYGKKKGENRYSITRKYVPKKAAEIFKGFIPNELMPHLIGITEAEILPLAPHIHTDEQCVINFYRNTSGEVTSIYEGNIEIYDGDLEDKGNGYYLVNPKFLLKTEEFTAKDGDVWLLNTKQPHSVESSTKILKANRVVVQAFFSLPYEQVTSYL